MHNLIRKFLRDEAGSVVVGEWAFVATILVLGAFTGMVALHHNAFDDREDAPTAAAANPQTAPASAVPLSGADGR